MKTYYGYTRISTVGQKDTSIEVQTEYLRLQSKQLGLNFKTVSERKSGRSVIDRPVLVKLLTELREGDVLGVYDNSRLGRNTSENLQIINELNQKGIKVQVNGKIVDLNDPEDELLFSVQSSVSTYQRKSQALKAQAGINLKRSKGDWILRGDVWGYRLYKSGGKTVVTIVEEEAELIRFMYEEYCKGESVTNISRKLNNDPTCFGSRVKEFHKVTVRKILFRPLYMGYYLTESKLSEQIHRIPENELRSLLVKSNYYPPIVSEDVWWSVFNSYVGVKRVNSRQFMYRWTSHELSSVISCSSCLKNYVHNWVKQRSGDINEKYVCNVHTEDCKDRRFSIQSDLAKPVIRVCYLIVFANVEELPYFYLDKQKDIISKNKEYESRVKNSNTRLKEIEKEKKRLIELAVKSLIDDNTLKDYLFKVEKEEKELKELVQSIAYEVADEEWEVQRLMEESKEEEVYKFLKGNSEYRRSRYLSLIESALLYKTELIITFKNGKKFVVSTDSRRGDKTKRYISSVGVSFRGVEQFKFWYDTGKIVLFDEYKSSEDVWEEYTNKEIVKLFEQVQVWWEDIVEDEPAKDEYHKYVG